MIYPNKYAKSCKVCGVRVAVGAGFIQKNGTTWDTYCSEHVPERKTSAPARRILTADGKIITPYEPQNVPIIKSLPGAFFHGKGCRKCGTDHNPPYWSVSLAEGDRHRVLEVADRLGLEVAPELRTIAVNESTQNAINAGLYDFQVKGVQWLSHRTKALLGDEMGLGKTVEALTALSPAGYGLVVAPAGLKYNWRDEAQRWRPDLKVEVLEGRGSFRFPTKGELVITNFDILPDWLVAPKRPKGLSMQQWWEQLRKWREELKARNPLAAFVTLIVDEAHKVKNYQSDRSQKVKELSRLVRAVWGLTGTPLENRAEDLFGVLSALHFEYEVFGGSALDRFRQLFHAYQDGRRGRTWWVYGQPDPIVPELLQRVMLRRRRADVLPDLPAKTFTTHVVGDMDATLRRQLDELWDEWGLALEVDEELPPFEKFSEIREKLARSRIPAMLEYVENAEEQDVPMVVFSAHLAPMDELMTRPGWAVITGVTSPERRQEIVRDFQAGRLKGVGCTIRAGGVGLTLTRAWKALFVDLDWTPAANSQAEDRICRIGQKSNKVEIIRMVSDHPLDLHVLKLLAMKMALIEAAIETKMEARNGAPKPANGQEETQAEFEARMARVLAAQEELAAKRAEEEAVNQKARGKAKVGNIHEREQRRNTRKLLPLTPERTQAVKQALGYMLSVCDGAVTWDAQGFNKPDAIVARYLAWAGLENQQELEAAYFMLVRYHRQLSPRYPILFE